MNTGGRKTAKKRGKEGQEEKKTRQRDRQDERERDTQRERDGEGAYHRQGKAQRTEDTTESWRDKGLTHRDQQRLSERVRHLENGAGRRGRP